VSEIVFEEILSAGTNSLDEFRMCCLEISHHFTSRSVIALVGPLGAGKTELVRTIAQSRGFQGMASPTFAIHHRYQGFSVSIDHLDLYRLQNEDELDGVGFWDFFAENEGLIFIEWPERMNLEHIPWDWDLFLIEIEKPAEAERKLHLTKRCQTTA
jgi:tRNA threonylcarbamoyladenosine biosynthesis protein TsaE